MVELEAVRLRNKESMNGYEEDEYSRRYKRSEEERLYIINLIQKGTPIPIIIEITGISRSGIYKIKNRYNIIIPRKYQESSYLKTLHSEKEDCQHRGCWIMRCSHCNEVLASDNGFNAMNREQAESLLKEFNRRYLNEENIKKNKVYL